MENEVREQYPEPPRFPAGAAEQTEHSLEEFVIKDASFYLTKAQISVARELAKYVDDDSAKGFAVWDFDELRRVEMAAWGVHGLGAGADGKGGGGFRAGRE